MIDLYIIGLFVLAGTSVYALIQSKTNRVIVFVLVPLILVMSLYTWRAVTLFQGSPIMGLPYDKQVQIVYVSKRKPNILLLLKHKDTPAPTYYAIPWTKENAQKITQLENYAKKGVKLDGKFKMPPTMSNSNESPSIEWEPTRDYSADNLKNK